MGKIKKIFSNILASIRQTYIRFPATIIIVYILTIIFVFCQELIEESELFQHILFVMNIGLIGIFFTETKTDNKRNRIIGTVISVAIGIIFDRVILINDSDFGFLYRLLGAYTISVPILSIYNLIKKSEIRIEEYSIKAFANICKASITYFVLNIGIAIVMSIFIVLILDGENWDILLKTLGLILGMYYIPALINSFSDMQSEVGKFIKGLIVYVAMPLIVALVTIIYIYLLKISISGELLNKAIFFILALIFTLAFPVIVLLKNYDENKIIRNIINILTYAYIPFIFLEIYSMQIRVSDYGITPSRYMGYMLIIFEIAFISLLIIKKSKYLKESILFFILLVLVGTISPVNIVRFPAQSQSKRLSKMIESAGSFNNLSDEDKGKCYGAYVYLASNFKEYINISETEIAQIKEYREDKYSYNYNSSKYLYKNKKIDGLDISKYKKIYETSVYSRKNTDISNISIKSSEDEIEIRADLKDYFNELVRNDKLNNGDNTNEFEENNIVKVDNGNFDLYITSLSITYDEITYEIISYNFSGYLFENN